MIGEHIYTIIRGTYTVVKIKQVLTGESGSTGGKSDGW